MKRKILAFGICVIFIVSVVIVLFLLTPAPPAESIKKARNSLAKVGQANAIVFAPIEYKETLKLWERTMIEWKAQNERFFPVRDFSLVQNLADSTVTMANEAIIIAAKNKHGQETSYLESLKRIMKKIEEFRNLYSRLPLSNDVSNAFSKGNMLIEESRISYNRQEFSIATDKLAKGCELIERATDKASEQVKAYFNDYTDWKKSFNKALSVSKNRKQALIVIDKFAALCYLYHNGELKNKFPAEFGKNWMADKTRKGDKATPEGIYLVEKKKSGAETKYYRALLIDYPNEDDKERFKKNKAKGLISPGASIGGLIEIHGDGGKGMNWTDGCIALKNDDMDILYKNVMMNTPVLIVGSLENFDSINQ